MYELVKIALCENLCQNTYVLAQPIKNYELGPSSKSRRSGGLNVESGCNRFRVRILTVGQGHVSALTPSACQKSPRHRPACAAREEICPWILASATSPFTVVLPASLPQELSETSQALVAASFRLWETKPLRPNLLRAVNSDAALILVELMLVLPVVALDDPWN